MRGFSLALVALGLAVAAARADPRSTVSGIVTDATGAVVAGAAVSLRSGLLVVVRSARSDGQGAFAFADVVPGSYLLVASARGLAEARLAVRVGPAGAPPLAVVLHPAPRNEEITVTASPGRVDPAGRVSQPVNVIGQEAVAVRAKAGAAQVASEEAGLALQRTSSTMGGIFVRGLTGNKVSVFVDGVRYSTSSARGGVNTFLNLIDPGSLDRVEVLRGPSSAQ